VPAKAIEREFKVNYRTVLEYFKDGRISGKKKGAQVLVNRKKAAAIGTLRDIRVN